MEKRVQNKYVLILVENSRYTPTEITDIASFTKYYVVEIPPGGSGVSACAWARKEVFASLLPVSAKSSNKLIFHKVGFKCPTTS